MTTLLRGFHISSLAWVGDFMPIREPYAAPNRAQSNPRLKNSPKRIKTFCKKKCYGIKEIYGKIENYCIKSLPFERKSVILHHK